jgi:signal peptidase
MMSRVVLKRRNTFMSAAILIGMVAVWSLFAPLQFGGGASYVLVAGASMEPSLHTGDLVITRNASTYDVGEVVTYTHPDLGPIIHRIIEVQGSSFTLQGDNNDWIDSYQPTQAEILGKSWITIPGAAFVLHHLRTPLGLLLLSLSIGIMVLVTINNPKAGKPAKGGHVRRSPRSLISTDLSELKDNWSFVLLVLILGGLLLGFVAFSTPLQRSIVAEIPYQHQGYFNYQAVGMPSVYDDGRIEAGEAIFHSLVSSFDVTFEYQLLSDQPTTAGGTYQLLLEVSEPNGWRRSMELIPSTAFSGTSFAASAEIDLDHILWLVESLKDRTGFNRSVFNVRIIPEIEIEGTIAGHELQDRYAPALEFLLDDYQLYMANNGPDEQAEDPLNPQAVGMIAVDRQIPATLSILGIEIRVDSARWIAGLALVLGLAGAAALWIPTLQAGRQGESERIRSRYAESLLEVDKLPHLRLSQTYDVARFEDLVKIVQSKGGLIMHAVDADQHVYLVLSDEGAYRFILHDVAGEPA